MKPTASLLRFAPIIASFALATSAHAASDSWNVDAAGTWVTTTNWLSGSQTPGSPTTDNADVAIFSKTLTAGRIVTVDATRYIGGIDFGNTSSFGYTLSGGALNLNSGGVIQTLAGNGNHTDTISTPIKISGTSGATAAFTAGATSATSLLSIGAVTGSATAGNTTTLTLNGSNTGANAITGIIGNGAGGGKLAITKSGTGTWVLSGNNTFTGGVVIRGGTLKVTSTGGLNSATAHANNNAVTLGMSGDSNPVIDVSANVFMSSMTVGSSVTGAKVRTSAWGGPQVTGNLTLNSALTIEGYGTGAQGFQVGQSSGKITGNGAGSGNDTLIFDRTGSGAFYFRTYTTANDFVGNVRVQGGQLNFYSGAAANNLYIPDASMLTLTSGGSFVWNGVAGLVTETLDGLAGNGSMSQSTATYTLTINANNADNEGDRIFSGNLVGMTGALTLGGTGTQEFSGATPAFTNATNLNNGTLKLTDTTAWNSDITLGGSNSPKLQLNGTTGTWKFGKLISGGSAGATVEKTGAGAVVLTGSNTYTGSASVKNGVLQLAGGDNRLSSSTSLSLGDTGTSGKLVLGSTGVSGVTDAKSDLTVAGLSSTGLGGSIVGGNSTVSTLTVNLASGTNTFDGTLGGVGANENKLALTKSGAGTLTLTGNNTYTGATMVSAGTLLVSGQLGETAVTVGNGGTIGGDGIILGSLNFATGAKFAFGLTDTLTVNGTVTFGTGFGVDDLVGLTNAVALGTYKLIDGTSTDFTFAGLENFGAGSAYDLGGGKTAYFKNGSLDLVVVPEPTAAALFGSLGLLALLRRRRA